MNQSSTPASTTAPQIDAAKDAFDRLTLLGWRWGLAAIVGGLAASFFLFGYALIYWRNADMDFMVIYNALVLNDGKPQLFLLIATGCVLIFADLVRRVVRDWRVAMLATLAIAFSGGVAVHSRILRSELVAACPVIFALLLLIVVGRRAGVARPLAMAAAAALCVLGLENKVQAILLIGALPLLILPFGAATSASVAFWNDARSSWLATVIAAIAAIAAAWAVWPLIGTGFDRALLDTAHFHPLLLGRFGIYQAALLVLIGGCMTAYAAIWRVSAAETLASIFAMAAGASIALLALDLEYSTSNVIAVFNPLEKMLTFADASTTDVANGSNLFGMMLLLLDGVASVLARYSFVLHSSPRPTVFLTWLIVPGIILAWRRGEGHAAIQTLALLLAAIGIDALGVRRGLKSEYFIFTDPLIILAGAILLDSLGDLRFHKWAYPLAVALFGLHIAVGQAEPIKYAFMRRGPESICEWNQVYMPLLPLPWCPLPPVRP